MLISHCDELATNLI